MGSGLNRTENSPFEGGHLEEWLTTSPGTYNKLRFPSRQSRSTRDALQNNHRKTLGRTHHRERNRLRLPHQQWCGHNQQHRGKEPEVWGAFWELKKSLVNSQLRQLRLQLGKTIALHENNSRKCIMLGRKCVMVSLLDRGHLCSRSGRVEHE